MSELQLWQSIASLYGAVKGLEVKDVSHNWNDGRKEFQVWVTRNFATAIGKDTKPESHRFAALLIVDAIEASSDWRFSRGNTGEWCATLFEFQELIDAGERLPEHLSLLTVIERVMREVSK